LVKGYNNGILSTIHHFTIGIGENARGSLLRSNIQTTEINKKILFDTNTYRINQSDILMIDRDFGDDNRITNETLTMEYIYTTPGKKIVSQTIYLKDGKTITNMITIHVIDTTTLSSYALLLIPSKLIANIGENISMIARTIGNKQILPKTHIIDFSDENIQYI